MPPFMPPFEITLFPRVDSFLHVTVTAKQREVGWGSSRYER